MNETNQDQKKYIVVREVIRKKNPAILKWMPRFVLRYLERIIHEDEINDIMNRFGHLYGLDFIDALILDLGIDVELVGAANIPQDGGVIFASNHPLGGLDGIALMHALGKHRKDIKFLVNDILMNIRNLEPLFIPVNKLGRQDKRNISMIEEGYAQDHALLVFPAGLVSRKNNGVIKDKEWKKSFINKSKKYKKDIVPVFIDGRNSNFFYNLARLRESIGIKTNIEMLYLADEMFAQRNNKVTIHVGEPISYTHFDNTKNERQWAEEMKQRAYHLAEKK